MIFANVMNKVTFFVIIIIEDNATHRIESPPV